MSTGTGIQWTEATWNPVVGCTWASPGCDFCYAAKMTARLEAMGNYDYVGLTSHKHFNGTVRTLEHRLAEPLKWKKPRVVFVNSMSDLFHPGVPFEFIDKVFAVMALTPHHTYQVLTKRPERMAEYTRSHDVGLRWAFATIALTHNDVNEPAVMSETAVEWTRRGLPNVWLGTSVEDQQRADERIPHLLACPASVRFLSCEPLIGPVDLRDINGVLNTWHIVGGIGAVNPGGIHWVIVGGESGPGARPCYLASVEEIVEQCRDAGVACFVKQLGAQPRECGALKSWPLKLKDKKGGDISEWPAHLRVRQFPVTEGAGA